MPARADSRRQERSAGPGRTHSQHIPITSPLHACMVTVVVHAAAPSLTKRATIFKPPLGLADLQRSRRDRRLRLAS